MNPFALKRFAQTFFGLAIVLTICEILVGYYRDPIPDIYRGEIYIGEKYNKVLVKDIAVTLEIAQKGMIFGARPYFMTHGLRINLDGENANLFEKFGLKTTKIDEEYRAYLLCDIGNTETDTYSKGYIRYLELRFTKDSTCQPALLGALNFDDLELTTKTPSGTPIFMKLKRDSHIGIIQRTVLRLNYDPNDYGSRSTLSMR